MGCVCGAGVGLRSAQVIESAQRPSPLRSPLPQPAALAKQSNSSDATAQHSVKQDPKAVVLIYYDALGHGEVIRILLKFLSVDFVDRRVTREEWERDCELAEFGKCPVLLMDGKRLVQTRAILRYVAQKHGLYPAMKDFKNIYLVESAWDLVDEIKGPLVRIMEEGDKQKLQEQYAQSDEQLRHLSQRLVQNKGGKGWFVGSQISITDICVVQLLWDFYMRPGVQQESRVPEPLKAYMQLFLSLYNQVKGYLITRPAAAF